jgi:hypothetical protein
MCELARKAQPQRTLRYTEERHRGEPATHLCGFSQCASVLSVVRIFDSEVSKVLKVSKFQKPGNI